MAVDFPKPMTVTPAPPVDPAVSPDPWLLLSALQRQRVSDGAIAPLVDGSTRPAYWLLLVWPQLGDFDTLEYAWWLGREREKLGHRAIVVRAVAIGDRGAGQQFCRYTGFPEADLFVDPTAEIHRQLGLYAGLNWTLPGLAPGQRAWWNLLLMCAGLGSPGTLGEVWRGYRGDRAAPQLIGDGETVQAWPLPPLTGSTFRWAGGQGYQRPLELATLRLRNMGEVLRHWSTYVPDPAYLTQRGGTFLFDASGGLRYEHRDRGILGFTATPSRPLAFCDSLPDPSQDSSLP